MTPSELCTRLQSRLYDAEAMNATALVADVLRVVLGELEAVNGVPNAALPPDRLLGLEEASEQLGVTVRWLRETRPPYVVELSPRMLRVSQRKLDDWLRRH